MAWREPGFHSVGTGGSGCATQSCSLAPCARTRLLAVATKPVRSCLRCFKGKPQGAKRLVKPGMAKRDAFNRLPKVTRAKPKSTQARIEELDPKPLKHHPHQWGTPIRRKIKVVHGGSMVVPRWFIFFFSIIKAAIQPTTSKHPPPPPAPPALASQPGPAASRHRPPEYTESRVDMSLAQRPRGPGCHEVLEPNKNWRAGLPKKGFVSKWRGLGNGGFCFWSSFRLTQKGYPQKRRKTYTHTQIKESLVAGISPLCQLKVAFGEKGPGPTDSATYLSDSFVDLKLCTMSPMGRRSYTPPPFLSTVWLGRGVGMPRSCRKHVQNPTLEPLKNKRSPGTQKQTSLTPHGMWIPLFSGSRVRRQTKI